MRLLITGSSGYIGSVLSKVALEKGHFVIGADTVPPEHRYFDEFICDNVTRNLVSYTAANMNVDAVFHLAASADVTHSTTRPSLYYHNNVGAMSKLLDNLLMMGWSGPVIFSSTAAVYGEKNTPCLETDELNPFTAYGKSKLMCEQYLNDLWECNNIPSISFRYFNVAGAYDDAGDHLHSDHVIQKLCLSAVEKKPFKIFGNNYSTSDGTCVRDFIHVLDICEAHFHALEYLKQNKQTHVFNLGTNNGVSVKQLVDSFSAITNKKITFEYDNPRKGDPEFLVANPSKFINDTGFEYKHSSIDKIIDSAWKWYRRQYNAV